MRTTVFLFVLLFFLSSFSTVKGQNFPEKDPPTTRILFIFDASYSMNGQWESDKKINIARDILMDIIDSLEVLENVQMALRVYGHQSPVPPQDCEDSKLEVPFRENNASAIRQRLRFISPKGTTPISYSLERGGEDFPDKCDNCRNIIILITDGIEECDGDPCEVSKKLQKKGIALKPFVIGIGIDEDFEETFDCIGHYYNATQEEQFKEVMGVVITQALNSTTAQVNLLDKQGLPTETNVNMTFYDKLSGKAKHNYIHTINYRGNPDTIILDPLITYRMVVHTIPPVEVDNIKVSPGKHTIIAADAPQGSLIVKSKSSYYRDLQFIVRKDGNMKTLNYQDVNRNEKYIIGDYDLEIPVLPRIIVDDVDIKQSHTTTVEIPRPGIVTLLMFSGGYGGIYIHRGNELEWVCNIKPNKKKETIVLQPGSYKVVYRAKNARNSLNTVTKSFEITPGGSESINLY